MITRQSKAQAVVAVKTEQAAGRMSTETAINTLIQAGYSADQAARISVIDISKHFAAACQAAFIPERAA